MRLDHLFFKLRVLHELRSSEESVNTQDHIVIDVSDFFGRFAFSKHFFFVPYFPGAYGEIETLVPIPNTIVKGLCGDGTAHFSVGE